MYTVTNGVGRLIMSTLASPVTAEDFSKIGDRWRHLLAGRKERSLVFGDYTRAKLVAPTVRQVIRAFFNDVNPDIERSAILVSAESSLIFEQFAAIIRESKHPSRRIFTDATSLEAWLGEVMTDEERAALKAALEATALPGCRTP